MTEIREGMGIEKGMLACTCHYVRQIILILILILVFLFRLEKNKHGFNLIQTSLHSLRQLAVGVPSLLGGGGFSGIKTRSPISSYLLGIPMANQIRSVLVRILSVSASSHDWPGFVHVGRSYLNYGIVRCRTGLSVSFTSRSISGYDRTTFFSQVCAGCVRVTCTLGSSHVYSG